MCGEDYDQVFAPTMTSETLKVALCKAGAEGMFVHHFDFMTAYLNAHLDEKLYMEQIPGCCDISTVQQHFRVSSKVPGLGINV